MCACFTPQQGRRQAVAFPVGVVGQNPLFDKASNLLTKQQMIFTKKCSHGGLSLKGRGTAQFAAQYGVAGGAGQEQCVVVTRLQLR
ncbi:hypothetical protein KU43P_01290 [Pseudomonas sp. KU43P]|nr:hypothetical protein KU43P_01290 [Pseudomonas sp. KU43P]